RDRGQDWKAEGPAGGQIDRTKRRSPVKRETASRRIQSEKCHSNSPRVSCRCSGNSGPASATPERSNRARACRASRRSEEHTSELQSRGHLVCRLLLEKK